MVSRFPLCLSTGAHPLHTPLDCRCLFLVGCWVSHCQSAAVQRQWCISHLKFFSCLICHPQSIIQRPPHTFCRDCISSIMIPSLLTPTFGWLLCLTLERQPPKAVTPSLSLCFGGSCFGAPSKGTCCGDREPATGRLLLTHGESRRQDLGVPLPYPWRERARPLESRVAVAHFGCCVLWLREIIPQNCTSNCIQNFLKNLNFWEGFGYDLRYDLRYDKLYLKFYLEYGIDRMGLSDTRSPWKHSIKQKTIPVWNILIRNNFNMGVFHFGMQWQIGCQQRHRRVGCTDS